MANLNLVQLIGNLTRDPELSYIPSGTAVVKTCIAVNENWTKDGEKHSSVQFINLTIWGKGGEVFAQYTQKGSPVYVSGKLKIDKVPDRNNPDQNRYFTNVVVKDFQFLGRKGDGPAGGGNTGASLPSDEYGDGHQGGVDPGFAGLPDSGNTEWEIPETASIGDASETNTDALGNQPIDDDDIPF